MVFLFSVMFGFYTILASSVANEYFVQVNEVLSEVSLIKDRQEDLDGKLDTMKNENEALWREVGALKDFYYLHLAFTQVLSLRQKHTQQQKIVNKLIQFLVALVQPRMGGASLSSSSLQF